MALSARLLAGSRTLPIAVVDFPRGISATPAKVDEARRAIATGAQELDMVVNLAALHARDYALVFRDIEAVVEASGYSRTLVEALRGGRGMWTKPTDA